MVQVKTGQGQIPAERIEAALEKAIEAFWMTFSEQFPEVTTGDMSPGDDDWLEQGAERSAKVWLMWNHPDGMPLDIDPEETPPILSLSKECPKCGHAFGKYFGDHRIGSGCGDCLPGDPCNPILEEG